MAAIATVAAVAVPAHASGPAPWESQRWDFNGVGIPNVYELTSEQAGWGRYGRQLCVDDDNGWAYDGNKVLTWQCDGGYYLHQGNQEWEVRQNIDGTVSFISVLDDTKCLDVAGWNTNNGAGLQLWTCAWTTDANGNHGNHANQEFWTGANPFNDWTWDGSVRSAMDPNKCLTADNNAGQDSNGDNLILWSCGTFSG
jgi:hypothetical protein